MKKGILITIILVTLGVIANSIMVNEERAKEAGKWQPVYTEQKEEILQEEPKVERKTNDQSEPPTPDKYTAWIQFKNGKTGEEFRLPVYNYYLPEIQHSKPDCQRHIQLALMDSWANAPWVPQWVSDKIYVDITEELAVLVLGYAIIAPNDVSMMNKHEDTRSKGLKVLRKVCPEIMGDEGVSSISVVYKNFMKGNYRNFSYVERNTTYKKEPPKQWRNN